MCRSTSKNKGPGSVQRKNRGILERKKKKNRTSSKSIEKKSKMTKGERPKKGRTNSNEKGESKNS